MRGLAAALVVMIVAGSLRLVSARGVLDRRAGGRSTDRRSRRRPCPLRERKDARRRGRRRLAQSDALAVSNRIATPIDAPNLTSQGFTFVGGRLLPGSPESVPTPAAQLMYENAAAERLTLYITAPLPDKKEVWKFEFAGRRRGLLLGQ